MTASVPRSVELVGSSGGIHLGAPGARPEERITAAFLVRYPPPTRAEYARDLRSFAAWCGGIGVELLGVERAHVERWVRHLLEEQGRRPSTVRRRLAVLQGFYAEATDQGVIGRAPTIRVRRPRLRDPQRLGLDRHQAHALLAAAEAAGPRDHALVCLLLLNGLRVSEAVGARAGDLSTARGHRLLRIVRKGGPVVEVPLAPRTARAVDAQLVERSLTPGDAGSPLLASGLGEPMSRHAASRAVCASPSVRASTDPSALTSAAMPSSPRPWTPASRCGTSRTPPATPTRRRLSATTAAAIRSTATPPTPSQPSSADQSSEAQ